jgi:hypothetical protein
MKCAAIESYLWDMERKKPGVDVILDILKAATSARPDSPFLASLHQQYEARGFLTKRQMEGLHAKSSKLPGMPAGKLATLQAIIQKMPTRQKSEKPEASPVYSKSVPVHIVISRILEKYPEHRQVLLFKEKFDSNIPLSPREIADLMRFYQLLAAGPR